MSDTFSAGDRMSDDTKTWTRNRLRLVRNVTKRFEAAGREACPTVREVSQALRLSQKTILALAEDAKAFGELEINVAYGGNGGVAEIARAGDYQLEPCL